ncbi:LOW QUALITY PROTEIN: hypothetical protein U9M48_037407 [Paspalum notatum var. saurae]|uniref:Reverse transcriptase domain-containing protein n=1 Tax=Paspalum notatum var. saurae TaxID=547442 RepID=A0AAQ3UGD3_PASNO
MSPFIADKFFMAIPDTHIVLLWFVFYKPGCDKRAGGKVIRYHPCSPSSSWMSSTQLSPRLAMSPSCSHSLEETWDGRASLYADDVIHFIHPTAFDFLATTSILKTFGGVSGLQTNMHKSLVLNRGFAVRGVQLPLQIPRLTTLYLQASDLQPIIDKLADLLPGWKAALLNLAEQSILAKAVLTVVPIYLLIAIDAPKWLVRAINKRRRAFLW